ncbi:MAG: prepilin-type N-terminal cleavage/methylation domain-containing protein [Porticoccaceae bacterium]|nr:prepilin-type N-terminal cleavage/methylation domain-containing protein [Porticoccaceae bacterium]
MSLNRRYTGFTLLEVLAVIIIVATLSGMSLLAINQAFDRRYESHADQLQMWLQQLSDLAALSGGAYGVVHIGGEGNGELGDDSPTAAIPEQLQAVVYYKNSWWVATEPAPFGLSSEAQLHWDLQGESQFAARPEQLSAMSSAVNIDKAQPILPVIALLPDGYMDPVARLKLRFKGHDNVFELFWDDRAARIELRRSTP